MVILYSTQSVRMPEDAEYESRKPTRFSLTGVTVLEDNSDMLVRA